MYSVKINDKFIYYPANDTYTIYNAVLSQEIGYAGEFNFSVPPTNPQYSKFETGGLVFVYKDDVEIWRGEILSVSYDFSKVARVCAIEDLAWLGDSVFLSPASISTYSYTQQYQKALARYNNGKSSERRFEVGNITNLRPGLLCNWVTKYEDTVLDAIRNCICKDSGFLKVRREVVGGTLTRYLDCLGISDYGTQINQPIEFGYNLLDYTKIFDLSNLCNHLYPFGAETDDEIYDGYNRRIAGNILIGSSISIYGEHAKTVIFDNMKNTSKLNNAASDYFEKYSQPQIKLEVTAVDLSEIDNLDPIGIGDSVRVIAKPFGIDQWLYATNYDIDLQRPEKNKVTLAGSFISDNTITEQVRNQREKK